MNEDMGVAHGIIVAIGLGIGASVKPFFSFLTKRLHLSNKEREQDLERDEMFYSIYNKREAQYQILKQENKELKKQLAEVDARLTEMQQELEKCKTARESLQELVELLKRREEAEREI